MLTAIFIIIGLSVLVLIHELGHFLAAKQAGIKVEEFGFGFPPRITGWRRGETLYSINWLPFGGFVRIYGENKHRMEEEARETGKQIDELRSFAHQPLRTRLTVIAAGISINFIAGWLLLSLVFMLGAHEAVLVTEILPHSPAATALLQKGDELVGFTTSEEFIAFTNAHQGESVSVRVVRDGTPLSLNVQLRKSTSEEPPLGAGISKIGFPALSFFASLREGLVTSVVAVGDIFKAFGNLIVGIFGHASVPENIVGPVGIFGIAGDLGKLGFVYIIQLVAMISLNLAALNAIPFPALDGGRILFLLIEKLKGSALNPKREMWANLVSFAFLVILMVIITGRDIVRLF